MARGGRRTGKPGKAYPARTDLNPVPAGLPYGERKTREAQVAALPLPTGQSTGQAAGQAPPGPPAVMSRPAPVPMNAPTQRPNEPLTHGLSTGPGGGPEAIGGQLDPATNLRRIYAQYPTEDLRALIEDMDNRAV